MNIKQIKIIHSIIWLIMVLAIVHLLYAGLTNTLHWSLWISFGLLVLEGIALLLFKGSCPLTLVAKDVQKQKYRDGDDIFLPKWVAIHNKLIFGSLLAVALVLLALRLFL